MAKKSEVFDYRTKAVQLEDILTALQNPDIQIDEATKLHAAGLKLIEELETYLKQAENEVRKHTGEA
jgi:exodeoxyribonuclease VII small subunit